METNKELLISEHLTVEVKSYGKSEKEAVEKSFKLLNQEVFTRIEGYLVKLNVTSFTVLAYQNDVTIKKFLGLFMPVEHESITMAIQFKVDINYIGKGE